MSQRSTLEDLTENHPVDGISQGQHAVAKLYDAVYIDDDEFYVNPFLVADMAMSKPETMPPFHAEAINMFKFTTLQTILDFPS